MNQSITLQETFQGALDAFFERECPQIGGSRTRQTLVNFIYNMVLQFFPETNHLHQGQIVWTTVHKNARGSYGKSIKDTELTPVVRALTTGCPIDTRTALFTDR